MSHQKKHKNFHFSFSEFYRKLYNSYPSCNSFFAYPAISATMIHLYVGIFSRELQLHLEN